MNLDDLLENVRSGLPISPQDGARHKKKISVDKFFAISQELTAEGTYKGEPIHPQHRKEAFTHYVKKGDKIGLEKFLDSVLAKKANPAIDFNGTGGTPGVKPKNQKLLTGTTFAPPDQLEPQEPTWVKLLKGIGKRLENVLNVLKGKASNAEDAADDKGHEAEKAKRKKKESDKEASANKLGIPGPIKKMIQPVTSLWETITQMLGVMVIGWGVTKLLKWLSDPENEKAVEQFKDFVVTFLPPILKGLLALAAFNIATKLFLFTKSIITGAAGMIKALWGFSSKIFLWAAANPWLAAGIGLAALIGGAALLAAKNNAPEDIQGEGAGDTGLEPGDEVTQAGDAAVAAQTTKGGGIIEEIQKFKGGGLARGTDTVPAMLTPGEYVMSKNAVAMYGGGLFDGMNKAAGSTALPKRANGITYAAGGGLMGADASAGGSIGTSTGDRVSGAGVDTQLIAAQPGEFVMSKGAVQKYGVNTMESMNSAGGGTNKPKKATVTAARGGSLVPTFSGGGQVGVGEGEEKKKGGGLVGKIEGLVGKMIGAGVKKGAAMGFLAFGPPGALVGGGIGALGNVIDARIDGAAGKNAEQLMNNPPSGDNSDRDNRAAAIGASSLRGKKGALTGQGDADMGPPPMFSAIDDRNLSTLVTKSMYSVVG